jgi:hypothetical protein
MSHTEYTAAAIHAVYSTLLLHILHDIGVEASSAQHNSVTGEAGMTDLAISHTIEHSQRFHNQGTLQTPAIAVRPSR